MLLMVCWCAFMWTRHNSAAQCRPSLTDDTTRCPKELRRTPIIASLFRRPLHCRLYEGGADWCFKHSVESRARHGWIHREAIALPQTVKYYGFSVNKSLLDRTSIYEKHLNERHSVMLGKQLKPFSAEASLRTALGSPRRRSLRPSSRRVGSGREPSTPPLPCLGLCASNPILYPHHSPPTMPSRAAPGHAWPASVSGIQWVWRIVTPSLASQTVLYSVANACVVPSHLQVN